MAVDEINLKALLARLENHWIDQGAPILQHIRPGLTTGEISELLEPIGLRLPTEAHIWFQWHDGVDLGPNLRRDTHIGNWFRPLSLSRAVEDRQRLRALADQFERDGLSVAEHYWWPTWFPIGRKGNDPLVVDCSRDEGSPTPVWTVDWEDVEFYHSRAGSLTRVVHMWVDLFDAGLYTYDSEAGEWAREWEAIPLELRRTGLV